MERQRLEKIQYEKRCRRNGYYRKQLHLEKEEELEKKKAVADFEGKCKEAEEKEAALN